MTSSAITLDKELVGKPLSQELIDSFSGEQIELLRQIDETNDEMVELHESKRKAKGILARPQLGLGDYTERTTAGIVSDTFEVRRAKIRERMQSLLRKAIDMGLGNLAVIQRMCQRYDLSDYIRRKLQQ